MEGDLCQPTQISLNLPAIHKMFRIPYLRNFLVCLIFLVDHICVIGEDFAQPPEWSDETKSVFFDDARDALVGSPPVVDKDAVAASANTKTSISAVNWRDLVDAETLDTEVKRITNNLAILTKNPAQFKATKHNDARRELTMLGALFGVISEYPEEVRWQASADAMQQQCLHVAEICVQGSAESLAATQEIHVVLEELLRGENNESVNKTENLFPEFAPLMQRMKVALEDKLPTGLGKERNFRKTSFDVAHEAQLLAMLSQIIRNEEYGYADDEGYQAHADRLRETAIDLNKAANDQEFTKAVQAAAEISQSCAKCHADYRG